MRTVEHTFRGFNTAFLACAVINGCRCGNVRKVSGLTRKEESRNFHATILEFRLHLAKGEDREHLHVMQWSMAQYRGQLWLCRDGQRTQRALGAESRGFAEPGAWWAVPSCPAQRCPQGQVRLLLRCLRRCILLLAQCYLGYHWSIVRGPSFSLYLVTWSQFNIFCHASTIIFM